MRCPLCNVPMREVERRGVRIDVCTDCHGVWLDGGGPDKLLAAGRAWEEEYRYHPRPAYREHDDRGARDRFDREDRERGYRDPRDRYDGDDDRHRRKRRSFLEEIFDIFDD